MSIDNFTASLIEMAEAVKAKPELEREIASLREELRIHQDTISIHQLHRSNLEVELAEAKARLEEARRDRDEAMFRNLELEEKVDQFASVAGKLLGLVKPTPAPEPVAAAPSIEATPEYDWRNDPMNQTAPVATQYDTVTGQSEPVPVTPEPCEEALRDRMVNDSGPETWEKDKPYSYKPWYMTDEEWTSKGGHPKPTDEPIDTISW